MDYQSNLPGRHTGSWPGSRVTTYQQIGYYFCPYQKKEQSNGNDTSPHCTQKDTHAHASCYSPNQSPQLNKLHKGNTYRRLPPTNANLVFLFFFSFLSLSILLSFQVSAPRSCCHLKTVDIAQPHRLHHAPKPVIHRTPHFITTVTKPKTSGCAG